MDPTTPILIQLGQLDAEPSCLAREVAMYLYAAARVALDRHFEPPETTFALFNDDDQSAFSASWELPTRRHRHSWADEIECTEKAAECIALALLRRLYDLVVVARSELLTGADWVVATPNADLECASRVEVSGIDKSNRTKAKKRLAAKRRQVRSGMASGGSSLPARVVIVGMSAPEVYLAFVPFDAAVEQ